MLIGLYEINFFIQFIYCLVVDFPNHSTKIVQILDIVYDADWGISCFRAYKVIENKSNLQMIILMPSSIKSTLSFMDNFLLGDFIQPGDIIKLFGPW